MRNYLPYTKHLITPADIQAVQRVLGSDRLTQGTEVHELEGEFAAKVGMKYAIAVSSGTAALHLAYIAHGVNKDWTVVTSPITFVATVGAAIYCGATVEFRDVGPETGRIKDGPQPVTENQLFVPVHLGGSRATRDSTLPVVEDACHALGAGFDLEGTGCYSLHAAKQVAAGEGGIIATNDYGVAQRCWVLRDHGRLKGEVVHLGYNYRMNEMSAALARSQLERLDWSMEERRRIAMRYVMGFKSKVRLVPRTDDSAHHLFQILVEDRARVMADLKEAGIGTQIHYKPVYEHPYYRDMEVMLPGAIEFSRKCLSIPMYPDLSEDDQDYVIEQVIKCV